MYIAFVCFVLFDAQGGDMAPLRPYHLYGAAVLMAVMLCLGYIPGIFYRPQTGVDSLCDDLLCIAAHYACALLIHDQALRYSCILHSVDAGACNDGYVADNGLLSWPESYRNQVVHHSGRVPGDGGSDCQSNDGSTPDHRALGNGDLNTLPGKITYKSVSDSGNTAYDHPKHDHHDFDLFC